MLRDFAHFHPSITRLIQYSPSCSAPFSIADDEVRKADKVTVWPFSVCDPLPTWSRGKTLLIGDAAHPVRFSSQLEFKVADIREMPPFGGQGSNQAIEDTGALRCLFENVEPGESLTKSLDLFDRVRRRKVTRTQTMSKVRVGKEPEVRDELLQYADPPGSCECCHA